MYPKARHHALKASKNDLIGAVADAVLGEMDRFNGVNFGGGRSGPTEAGANFRQIVEEIGVALGHGFDSCDFHGASC